jgi:hypothetical protein
MTTFQPTEDTPLQFTEHDDMDEVNIRDLLEWVTQNKLVAIVDENEGGIIGYVHEFHSDRILNTLNGISDK